MCSIMGYCGSGAAFDDFKKGFDRTVSRGPDDSRIIYTGKGLLGFHRLSIMGLTPSGMQPFELDGSYVVCNGELYGFEKQKADLKQKGYEEFEAARKYAHATPFTKESLLYREIFEKYYPSQAEMIVDFRMPNKSWKGCDVNDPSARVLSNYGDSGK